MEAFGNVGRRILDNKFLAFAQCVRTIFRGAFGEVMYLGEDGADEGGSCELEVQERFVVRHG
jgi:hypothetical protein